MYLGVYTHQSRKWRWRKIASSGLGVSFSAYLFFLMMEESAAQNVVKDFLTCKHTTV